MCLAIPAKIIEVNHIHAIVEILGIKKRVNVQLIHHPRPCEYVLIHGGFAIEKIQGDEFSFLDKTIREMIQGLGKEGERAE